MLALGISLNMMCTGHVHNSESVNAVDICGIFSWGNDTIGCKYEATVERFKLINLFPPCVAVVAGEVGIFLKERIVLTGEHFRVSINVNSSSCCLLEELFKVTEVVTRDENAWILSNPDIYLGNFGITISAGICLVKQCHGFDTTFTHVEDNFHEFVNRDVGAAHLFKHLLYVGIHVIILVVQIGGVAGVGCSTFCSVNSQLF